MNRTDGWIRGVTAVVVSAVGGFAGIVSYGHLHDLAAGNGQGKLAAALLPLSVDGLIVAASLVLLQEARAGRAAPWLARACLAVGVAGTVAGNVWAGIGFGPVGALVSAWPAAAFIGSAELLMVMIRRARVRAPKPHPVPRTVQPVPPVAAHGTSNGHNPDLTVFREHIARGEVPGVRAIKETLHCATPRAQRTQEAIRAVVGQQ